VHVKKETAKKGPGKFSGEKLNKTKEEENRKAVIVARILFAADSRGDRGNPEDEEKDPGRGEQQ